MSGGGGGAGGGVVAAIAAVFSAFLAAAGALFLYLSHRLIDSPHRIIVSIATVLGWLLLIPLLILILFFLWKLTRAVVLRFSR
jgi:hypothetical protein